MGDNRADDTSDGSSIAPTGDDELEARNSILQHLDDETKAPIGLASRLKQIKRPGTRNQLTDIVALLNAASQVDFINTSTNVRTPVPGHALTPILLKPRTLPQHIRELGSVVAIHQPNLMFLDLDSLDGTKEGRSDEEMQKLFSKSLLASIIPRALTAAVDKGQLSRWIENRLSDAGNQNGLVDVAALLSSFRQLELVNPRSNIRVPMNGFALRSLVLGTDHLSERIEQLGSIVATQSGLMFFDLGPLLGSSDGLSQTEMRKLASKSHLVNPSSYFKEEENKKLLGEMVHGLSRVNWPLELSYRAPWPNRAFAVDMAQYINKGRAVARPSKKWLQKLTDAIFSHSLSDDERNIFILRHILGLSSENSDAFPLANPAILRQSRKILDFVFGYLKAPPSKNSSGTAIDGPMAKVQRRVREIETKNQNEEAQVLASLLDERKFQSVDDAFAHLKEGLRWARKLAARYGKQRRSKAYALSSAQKIILYAPLLKRSRDGEQRLRTFSLSGTEYATLAKHVQNKVMQGWEPIVWSSLYEKLRGLGPFMEIIDESGAAHFLRVADLYGTLFDRWTENYRRESDAILMNQEERRNPKAVYNTRVKQLLEIFN